METVPTAYKIYTAEFSPSSLAEAYMDHGDKELAMQNYRKSLELNPQNTNAMERLKQLSAP